VALSEVRERALCGRVLEAALGALKLEGGAAALQGRR
jgi:hypothetical protein